MTDPTIHQAFTHLLAWCRQNNFAGHDPFDALNSRLFQATPFRNSRTARLLWTQTLKRSPVDLRRVAAVPPEKNAKGIALIALAALASYRLTKSTESKRDAQELLAQLILLRIETEHGIAWGYNFDWQSRIFFAPRGTPTIVPTAFAVRALLEAAELFREDHYRQLASDAANFILEDLPRTIETETELCFSYAPGTATQVFNASLLAAETLARTGVVNSDQRNAELVVKATRYVVNRQNTDGSWSYGAETSQSWIDNFHTAYLLSSLNQIIQSCEAAQGDKFRTALSRGYEFWRKSFFLADGWAKYYHDTLYPVDTHAAAAAIVSLLDLRELDAEAFGLAERIAIWTIHNLRNRHGFFYYQLRRFYTVRTPFMRWTQAWMLYALARLLEVQGQRSQIQPLT